MNNEYGQEPSSNHNPMGPTVKHAKVSGSAWRGEFVRRVRAIAKALPSQIDERVKRTPYTMLGAACVVGVGFGVALSSRVLRGVVSAAATAVAVELVRTYVRERVSAPIAA
jgi:hypothetical protein